MKRLLAARIVLVVVGVACWGYGSSTDRSPFMFAGMGIILVALLLRFVPHRWFEDTHS